VISVHVAVNVTLADTVPVAGYVADAAYVLVPSNQPAKLYPVRVYVFAGVVKVALSRTEVGEVGADPEPPVPPAYEIV
jgi:hypothetical protein